ncbi:uncharacterized protein TNCV_4747091 [Trichonephila clavipes]|nr:uncharacterized protein TNCV_4747091 [Trichonephila clavipes]
MILWANKTNKIAWLGKVRASLASVSENSLPMILQLGIHCRVTLRLLSIKELINSWQFCTAASSKRDEYKMCLSLSKVGRFKAVGKCPKSWAQSSHFCSGSIGHLPPVTSLASGTTYASIFCAICHGDYSKLKIWNVELRCCPEHENLEGRHYSYRYGQFWSVVPNQRKCVCTYVAHYNDTSFTKDLELRQCDNNLEISRCSQSWENERVHGLCKSFLDPVYVGHKIYRNLFCAECNYVKLDEAKCMPPIVDRKLSEAEANRIPFRIYSAYVKWLAWLRQDCILTFKKCGAYSFASGPGVGNLVVVLNQCDSNLGPILEDVQRVHRTQVAKTRVDKFITSTLSISPNMKNSPDDLPNVLLFTLIQVDKFITSTLSISPNMKIPHLHEGGRHPRIGPIRVVAHRRSIAQELKIDHKIVLSHLSKAGLKKEARCLGATPINTKNMMHRISICEILDKRSEINPFLKRMVTGDEKWVTYDNIVRKRSGSKRGEVAQTVAKPGLTYRKEAIVIHCLRDYLPLLSQTIRQVKGRDVKEFSSNFGRVAVSKTTRSDLQEMKLPALLINTTNERRLVQGIETLLKVKGDIEDVSSELDKGS